MTFFRRSIRLAALAALGGACVGVVFLFITGAYGGQFAAGGLIGVGLSMLAAAARPAGRSALVRYCLAVSVLAMLVLAAACLAVVFVGHPESIPAPVSSGMLFSTGIALAAAIAAAMSILVQAAVNRR